MNLNPAYTGSPARIAGPQRASPPQKNLCGLCAFSVSSALKKTLHSSASYQCRLHYISSKFIFHSPLPLNLRYLPAISHHEDPEHSLV